MYFQFTIVLPFSFCPRADLTLGADSADLVETTFAPLIWSSIGIGMTSRLALLPSCTFAERSGQSGEESGSETITQ